MASVELSSRRPSHLGACIIILAALGTGPSDAIAQSSTRLDTVHVTVSSRAGDGIATSSRSVSVITRDEIARRPVRTVPDLLATMLGIDITRRSPAQADIAMRGSSTSQVLVLVDGVRATDQLSSHFTLDVDVPLEAIERIEILRGAGSTLYGPDAAGGVVNIVTRRAGNGLAHADGSPGVALNSIRTGGGSFGTVNAAGSASASVDSVGIFVSAEHERSDGHRAGTDYRVTQANGSVQTPLRGGQLRLDLGAAGRAFGAADFYSTLPSYERTDTKTASLQYAIGAPNDGQTSVTLSTRDHGDDYILDRTNPGLYRNLHRSYQTSLEATTRLAFSPSLRAAVGGEAYDARLTSARLGDRREERGALFLELTGGEPTGATLNGGTRVDWSSVNGTFVSPTVEASVPLSRYTRLRASASRGFRAPTWLERYYVDPQNEGDPTLTPETFWSGELGLLTVPSSLGSIDVAAFARRATGLIDWAKPATATATTPWRTMNVSEATYGGLEVGVELPTLVGAAWSLYGSALTFDTRGANGYVGKYALRPITRTAGARMSTPIFGSAFVTLDAGYEQRATESGHFRADARVAQRWRNLQLGVDLLNLTDADYLDAAGQPIARRAVLLTLGWSRE
ncbi:MAG TPA: TonB-dependent receptor [Gemmatimonadaceae bacterium]